MYLKTAPNLSIRIIKPLNQIADYNFAITYLKKTHSTLFQMR